MYIYILGARAAGADLFGLRKDTVSFQTNFQTNNSNHNNNNNNDSNYNDNSISIRWEYNY